MNTIPCPTCNHNNEVDFYEQFGEGDVITAYTTGFETGFWSAQQQMFQFINGTDD
jgi:hypothetical protein